MSCSVAHASRLTSAYAYTQSGGRFPTCPALWDIESRPMAVGVEHAAATDDELGRAEHGSFYHITEHGDGERRRPVPT